MQNTQIDPHNHEQQLAYELVANTNSSFFLTGRAGTGKTTFLHNVQKLVGKQFITLAPTGVAAILAGGDTIHSFFGLPMEVCTPGTCGKMNEAKILTLLHADTIIIDEVSMVRCDIMDAIDYTMRKALRNNMPFGGKQIIFVGDMFQLPPVVKQGPEKDMLKDLYQTDDFFFYKSDAIKRMRLVKIEFRKVYRQDDEHFLHILENVRLNKVTPENIMHLNDRVHIPTAEDGAVITLASINKTADKINLQRLEEIESEEFVYEGTIDGKFEEKKFPVDMKLRLKVGAQVMFTRNDQQKRWANGTLGKVSKLTKDEISVTLNNGETYIVPCCSWESYSYDYNKEERKMKKELIGTFTQYPLKLAWAITVHKSQGLTFSRVVIDFTGGVFAGGQAYVALSRCTSLDGIQLKKPINRADIFVRPEIVNFAGRFNDRQAIDKALKQAQADVQYAAAARAFDKGDMEECLEQFFRAIHSRYDIEKPVPRRLIRRKLGIINTLQEQNKKLKEQMREQQERLRQYAHEYLLMGNECITQAHDARAAIANYDKALSLDPNYIDAWIRKGITLFNSKEYFDAENCFNTAVSLHPANFKAVYNRGKLRLKIDNTEGAIADLDKATSLKPEHAGAHELFGDALLRVGKEVEAAIQWRIAEELRKKKS